MSRVEAGEQDRLGHRRLKPARQQIAQAGEDPVSLGAADILRDHTLAERALASARRRVDRGLGVLGVLHDLNVATRYADRVAIIENGRLTALGPPLPILDPERLSGRFRYTHCAS